MTFFYNLMQHLHCFVGIDVSSEVSKLCHIQENIKSLNPLNTELNPIRHSLALAGAHHFVHISRVRVNFNIAVHIQQLH
jgi:hypothetical protein